MIDNSKCWMKNKCDCSHCDGICLKHTKLNYLYECAYIPINKRGHIDLRIDEDKTDRNEFIQLKSIQDNIVDFVKNGSSLFLHSTQCGNGKTSWSYRLIQTYFNNIWETSGLRCRGIFINVPYFLLALKDNITEKSDYIQDIKENVLSADIIIWDDIATKIITPYESENLLSMIEMRINQGKANIFTSNLDKEDLKRFIGDRLASRIIGSTYNIELHGKDKRGL